MHLGQTCDGTISPILRSAVGQATYWKETVNHCPGCGRTSWIIGRFSAECSFCSAAMPLEQTAMLGTGTHARNLHFDLT